jgi:hypothetical protein
MASAGDYVRASDTSCFNCSVTQTTGQTLSNNTFTAITFDAADDVDVLGIHDPVTLNSRFVIGLKLGWWEVSGMVWYAAGTTATRRGVAVALNGTRVPGGINVGWASNGTAGGSHSIPPVPVQATVSTDYVELMGFQDTGGNLATTVVSPFLSSVSLKYLGS